MVTPPDFYTTSLALLSLLTIVSFAGQSYWGIRERNQGVPGQVEGEAQVLTEDVRGAEHPGEREVVKPFWTEEVWWFKLRYLTVYALVMGADWLQGPYVFSLYHDEFNLPIHTIAFLFTLGFLSAALSAPFIGPLADRYGRRLFCYLFCAIYTISCLTKTIPSPDNPYLLPLLVLGRITGGLGTSLLFTVFESWLVASSTTLFPSRVPLKSSSTSSSTLPTTINLPLLLSHCTLLNGLMAASSGIFSDFIVKTSGSFKSPFWASATLLVLAAIAIWVGRWKENRGRFDENEKKPDGGGSAVNAQTATKKEVSNEALSALIHVSNVIRSDSSLTILAITMTAFETSMYLFVFLWVPTLQDVLKDQGGVGEILPLGTIFSSFMVAMMLGSLAYNGLLRLSPPATLAPIMPLFPASASNSVGNTTSDLSPPATPLPSTPSPSDSNSTRFSSQQASSQSRESELTPLLPSHRPTFHLTTKTTVEVHSQFLVGLLLVAATALALPVIWKIVERDEMGVKSRFLAFVVFEVVVGVYYPVLGTLRSQLVPEDCRATITALLRVPLNLLITTFLLCGMEQPSNRELVAKLSAGMLVVAAAVAWGGLRTGR